MRFASRIAGLTGWRRRAVAFGLGTLSTLTLPPFFCFPLLIPSFTGLLWLLDGAGSRKRHFWDGWWWGWGFSITGLYWFCIALLTDAEKFAWLIPFALLGLTGVIALYFGVACLLTGMIGARGVSRIFIFSVVWMAVEYARGQLFTGFPWNLAGYAFMVTDASMQFASVIGAYGLTWFAVLLGASFAGLGDTSVPRRRAWLFIAAVWGTFALTTGWGAHRLSQANVDYVENVMLRLVQGNIAQPHKWDPELQAEGVRTHVRLTQEPGVDKVTHIIWPETALPYIVRDHTTLVTHLAESIPKGTVLLTGGLRDEEGPPWKVWNSLIAIDANGELDGIYDKARLVPFGEFLPFRSLIPAFLLTPVGDTDFSTGPGAVTLKWKGLPPMRPLICYEVIFPEMAHSGADADKERAQWLLSITNDAWFGTSTGPYQHFHMARLRAVEEGVPLVRVANTGISAVTDSYGRILASLTLGEQGVLDTGLPKSLGRSTTYGIGKEYPLLLLICIALVLKLGFQRRRKN